LYGIAGAFGTGAFWAYGRWLAGVDVPFDILHFSLHPVHAARWAFAVGLVLSHAGAFWMAAGVVRLVVSARRRGAPFAGRLLPVIGWVTGVLVVSLAARAAGVAVLPLLVSAAAAGLGGCGIRQGWRWTHRASNLGRLVLVFLAIWLPAWALYPTVHRLAVESKEATIERDYAPQTTNQRAELQRQLEQALIAVDSQRNLPQLIEGVGRSAPPATDQAFAVWAGTPLKTGRLTSAVELLSSTGRVLSRFSMNLPGSTDDTPVPAGCRWDVVEEVAQRGPSDRKVLRASRAVCVGDRRIGAVVVRVMLDYRTLPFISTGNPYLDSLQVGSADSAEAAPARDVELAGYGWSRAPLFTSGSRPWPLPDNVYQQLTASRTPHWETVVREGARYRVHFLSDRGGIYAIGFPVVTPLGHVVNLAELTILAFVAYLLLLPGSALFNLLTRRRFVSPRLLIREVRGSFYRRLFLAFVAMATVPVFVLALATRTYFSAQFRSGIEEAAAEAARVAQRLVEDYAVLEQPSGAALNLIDDDVMVLVSRTINQDVNLFSKGILHATSERDLFASGLLSRRVSGDVYRSITIDRLPTYVGRERVGGSDYLLAAAPVHAGGQDGIVTVPLTLRQQETERLSDEVDRRVVAASVLFVIVGAGLGYWVAERIADPVSRLSRATQRIARGDLDTRVAAESADELGRLVRDFNRMAADLTRQRRELERSKRLETWAEVARQVAHDIKNPLTPIQLAAEHARRVNLDRGAPLSPALDACVTTILGQVGLLRQIASEFSSFASTPAARPEPTSLGLLVQEVLGAYRIGLQGRVEVVLDVEQDLPEISIDRRLIGRALTNIIENALHAMSGRGTLRVSVRLERDTSGTAAAIGLRVADDGAGMDAEALGRIFEPYFSTKATGTGLGLTIAKRNVELHGGAIVVESRPGAGTTVTMKLPLSAQGRAQISASV
jgi:signal transduction histidine kinase